MRSRIKNITCTRLKILGTFILLMLLPGACYNKIKSEAENKNLIPEKDFISILTDVYLADGLLTIPKVVDKFSSRDSVSNYIDIIRSHGYTYDAMNRTLKYYFIKKPRKMVTIYDQVLAALSEMETRYEQLSLEVQPATKNLWPGKPVYEFPDTSKMPKTDFTLAISPPNTIMFEFSMTIYPDDKTFNPCFIAWYCNADSIETGKRTYLPQLKLIRDGYPHKYKITDNVRFDYHVVLEGSLLNFENNPGPAGIHARISDISLALLTQ